MPTNDYLSGSWLEWLLAASMLLSFVIAGVVLVARAGLVRTAMDAIPLGGIFGIAVYVLGCNALGYFLPIQTVFVLVAVLLVGAAVVVEGIAQLHPRWLNGPLFDGLGCSRRIAVATFVLGLWASASSTMLTLRVFLYDDIEASHVPSALLMARGRFPVEEPGVLGEPFPYHYAPDLLAGAMYRLTDLPVWYAYDVQIGWFAFLMVPAAFTVARLVSGVVRRHRTIAVAPFVAVMTIWAGPWNWLEFFTDPQVREAFDGFFGHPFSSISDLGGRYLSIGNVSFGRTATSIFPAMHNHSTAMGFVAALALVYWTFASARLELATRGRTASFIAMGVMSGALLALSTETIFSVLLPGLLVFGVFEGLRRRAWRPTLVVAGIVLLSVAAAKTQGGTLTNPISYTDGPTFRLNHPIGNIVTFRGGIRMYQWRFLIEWLPVMSLALTGVVGLVVGARRRRTGDWGGLAVALGVLATAFAAWLVPVVLLYVTSPVEIIRFFFPAFVAFAALSGIALAWIASTRFGWWIIAPLGAAMVLTSVTFQIHYSLFTLGTVQYVTEDGKWSPPQPKVSKPYPARYPYATNQDDLEDLEYFLSLDDKTVVFSVAPNGIHPNIEISGLQLQRPYGVDKREEYNELAMSLDVDKIRKVGVDVIYASEAVAAINGYDLSKLEESDEVTLRYENGVPGDRRYVYEIDDE